MVPSAVVMLVLVAGAALGLSAALPTNDLCFARLLVELFLEILISIAAVPFLLLSGGEGGTVDSIGAVMRAEELFL